MRSERWQKCFLYEKMSHMFLFGQLLSLMHFERFHSHRFLALPSFVLKQRISVITLYRIIREALILCFYNERRNQLCLLTLCGFRGKLQQYIALGKGQDRSRTSDLVGEKQELNSFAQIFFMVQAAISNGTTFFNRGLAVGQTGCRYVASVWTLAQR